MSSAPVIAIVDDDEAVRVATSCLVRSLGYSARTFASASEFLRACSDWNPACLITDVQMPGMSGIELHRNLIATGRRMPVIFVTAFPTEALREHAIAVGASGFLHKPYSGESIIRSLRDALNSSPSAQSKDRQT